MSNNSTFLFARPSFLEGVARVMDLGGTMQVYNNSKTEKDLFEEGMERGRGPVYAGGIEEHEQLKINESVKSILEKFDNLEELNMFRQLDLFRQGVSFNEILKKKSVDFSGYIKKAKEDLDVILKGIRNDLSLSNYKIFCTELLECVKNRQLDPNIIELELEILKQLGIRGEVSY